MFKSAYSAPALTTHDLRHSAISRWVAAGIDPVTVARWAGDDLQAILGVYAGDFETAKRGTSIVVYWPLELQSGWCDLVKALAVTLATKVPICFGLPPPHGEPKTLHQNSAT